MGKITSQELLTDPDCTQESAKSVSTSRTGSHARDGKGKHFYYLFPDFIACLNLPIPHE